MSVSCPECSSTRLKTSRVRDYKERLLKLVGQYPLRCRDCRHRFFARIWLLPYWKYARCPKCERMDLNNWSQRYYGARPLTVIALRLGAKPYRCEYCRCNFASFRLLKERFTFHKKNPKYQKLAEQAQEAEAS